MKSVKSLTDELIQHKKHAIFSDKYMSSEVFSQIRSSAEQTSKKWIKIIIFLIFEIVNT